MRLSLGWPDRFGMWAGRGFGGCMEQVTFTYGGVDLYAEVEIETYKEWTIAEIYVDDGTEWKFEHGLYDLVRHDVIEAANKAIFEVSHELVANKRRITDDVVEELR